MEWSSILTTLLGVPLGILPQVIDTRYFFCFKKYNALITSVSSCTNQVISIWACYTVTIQRYYYFCKCLKSSLKYQKQMLWASIRMASKMLGIKFQVLRPSGLSELRSMFWTVRVKTTLGVINLIQLNLQLWLPLLSDQISKMPKVKSVLIIII